MKKGVILIAILLVPSLVYMLFSLGEHNTTRLGFYGSIIGVDDNGDTLYASVKLPDLMGMSDNKLSGDELPQKVRIIHAFNWPCDNQCVDNISTLNNYLNKVERKEDWELMSICVDSISAQNLESLSKKRIYTGDNWQFYRLQNLADQSILDEVFEMNPSRSNPGEYIALLDQSNRVREYFNLRTQQDNKKLQDAIKLIIQEPHISWKQKTK